MKRVIAAAFFSIAVDANAPPLYPRMLHELSKRAAEQRSAALLHPTLVYRGR